VYYEAQLGIWARDGTPKTQIAEELNLTHVSQANDVCTPGTNRHVPLMVPYAFAASTGPPNISLALRGLVERMSVPARHDVIKILHHTCKKPKGVM
jgi:hypothetical protein